MKEYKAYMDGIVVEATTHERLVQMAAMGMSGSASGVSQSIVSRKFAANSGFTAVRWRTRKVDAEGNIDRATNNGRRVVLRWAGLAACAAVLALCVWAAPGLLSDLFSAGPGGQGAVSGAGSGAGVSGAAQDGDGSGTSGQQGGAGAGTSEPRGGAQGAPAVLYPLVLNRVDSYAQGNLHIPGHFWHPLNDAQLEAIFDVPLPIAATAHYRGDSSLFEVAATEMDGGEVALYGLYYTRTQIRLAPGEIMDDVVYDYEPVLTDVGGVAVIAGVFDHQAGDGLAMYVASFEMDGIAYKIELFDDETSEEGPERLTVLVNSMVQNEAPDLAVLSDPVAPELREEELTLEQARADADFGAYVPENVPDWIAFETAQRFINQENDYLYLSWHSGGYDYLQWRVAKPRADEGDTPILFAEELTLEAVQALAYQLEDMGDSPGWRMQFAVRYDDVTVHVTSKGLTPEEVWGLIS